MRKLKPREVKWLAQCHKSAKQQRWGENISLLVMRFPIYHVLTSTFMKQIRPYCEEMPEYLVHLIVVYVYPGAIILIVFQKFVQKMSFTIFLLKELVHV